MNKNRESNWKCLRYNISIDISNLYTVTGYYLLLNGCWSSRPQNKYTEKSRCTTLHVPINTKTSEGAYKSKACTVLPYQHKHAQFCLLTCPNYLLPILGISLHSSTQSKLKFLTITSNTQAQPCNKFKNWQTIRPNANWKCLVIDCRFVVIVTIIEHAQ